MNFEGSLSWPQKLKLKILTFVLYKFSTYILYVFYIYTTSTPDIRLLKYTKTGYNEILSTGLEPVLPT